MRNITIDRPEVEFVSKSWGYEKIIVNKPQYCGKILFIAKGKKTSLHYHDRKDETFYVHSGKVSILYSDRLDVIKDMAYLIDNSVENPELLSNLESVTLKEGDTFYVPQRRVHRIIGAEDSLIYEFSTQFFENDSKRLLVGG